jgi:hypothetical protein
MSGGQQQVGLVGREELARMRSAEIYLQLLAGSGIVDQVQLRMPIALPPFHQHRHGSMDAREEVTGQGCQQRRLQGAAGDVEQPRAGKRPHGARPVQQVSRQVGCRNRRGSRHQSRRRLGLPACG